jgi:hypothetical protein
MVSLSPSGNGKEILMRRRIGLACAMVLLSLAASSSVSLTRVGESLRPEARAVYCPELPADCCRWGVSNGCRICFQGGC